MKEYYFAVIKFPVMVSLSLIILLGLFFLVAFGANARTGLSMQEVVVYTTIFVALMFLVINWLFVLLSTHNIIRPHGFKLFGQWMLSFIYFPMAKVLSFITFQKLPVLQESFLHFNNEIVMSNYMRLENPRILVLLPHCLQSSECKIRITQDINDCADCGKCEISEIKASLGKYDVMMAVATGGSLARKIIMDNHPYIIIAVACHRDLTDGVRDSWRFPVYAVLNERPKGPCFETIVSIPALEFAIKRFQ